MFTQSKRVDGLIDPLLSKGVFYYHCDSGVIWKTDSPISQTLVFRQSGAAFSLQKQAATRLKTAQGKVLGRLLNSLIGGDQAGLLKQFDIVQVPESDVGNVKKFHLKPRKRSLKRGIKLIELGIVKATSEQAMSVAIAILDRKEQWTHITATKTAELDDRLQCPEFESLTEQECALLHES